jgi:hypothetical protein
MEILVTLAFVIGDFKPEGKDNMCLRKEVIRIPIELVPEEAIQYFNEPSYKEFWQGFFNEGNVVNVESIGGIKMVGRSKDELIRMSYQGIEKWNISTL